jgi:hypothetical protein
MSQADHGYASQSPGREVMRLDERSGDLEWADLRSAAGRLRTNGVALGAVVMIVLELAWKAQFLSTLYFRQDDFHDLELAVEHSFNWSYLTFIGSGHLIIGLRAIAWFMVRVSAPYNWGIASVVSLAFVAAASFAAYRLLRNLFGPRPMILILLALYLLSPLTVPDLGIWSSAMESVPLQLAIFMALNSHVSYVRTGRWWHLLFAVFWVAFGLAFFEKGLVLPLLLFAVTAAFLTDRRTLLAGALRALLKYWLAWAIYLVLDVGYAILLAISLRTSAAHPQSPTSAGTVASFAGGLVKESFLPGVLGGPWQWLPTSDSSYSFAAPPAVLVWISVVVAIVVIVLSVLVRRIAWRAWAILAMWIVLADILPVAIGRVNAFSPQVLALETRYLADAMPVLVVCLGLVFLPLVTDQQRRVMAAQAAAAHAAGSGHRRQSQRESVQTVRMVGAVLLGVFVFGSIWSVQAYENVTNGDAARTYIANTRSAVQLAPAQTPVFDVAVPNDVLEGLFGPYTKESRIIDDDFRGKLARKLKWITKPRGTIDGLRMFAQNGQLYMAQVVGAVSLPRPGGQACWPVESGQITVKLFRNSPLYTGILRLGYIWSGNSAGQIDVQFGSTEQTMTVKPGLHSAYLAVTGQASQVIVENLTAGKLCIGDAQAGNLAPSTTGKAIPLLSH